MNIIQWPLTIMVDNNTSTLSCADELNYLTLASPLHELPGYYLPLWKDCDSELCLSGSIWGIYIHITSSLHFLCFFMVFYGWWCSHRREFSSNTYSITVFSIYSCLVPVGHVTQGQLNTGQQSVQRGAVFTQTWLLSGEWEQRTELRGEKQSIDAIALVSLQYQYQRWYRYYRYLDRSTLDAPTPSIIFTYLYYFHLFHCLPIPLIKLLTLGLALMYLVFYSCSCLSVYTKFSCASSFFVYLTLQQPWSLFHLKTGESFDRGESVASDSNGAG